MAEPRIIDLFGPREIDRAAARSSAAIQMPPLEPELAARLFAVLLRRFGGAPGAAWWLVHADGRRELLGLPARLDQPPTQLELERADRDGGPSTPILDLGGDEHPDELGLHVRAGARWYATAPRERIWPAALARLLASFASLARATLSDPSCPSERLALLGEPERACLARFNDTAAELPALSVHALVARVVAAQPDAVALRFRGRGLSYAELDAQVHALARRLVAAGVERESLVRLVLDRGPMLIVAMLAVLTAGGAWVPVDPSYPARRVTWMLEDTPGPVILTHGDLVARLEPSVRLDLGATSILELSREPPLVDEQVRLAIEVDPEQIAYAIFTSGSTGRPKAVALTHRGLINLLTHAARQLGLGPGRRVLQFSSASFDVSVWEVFATLSTGATLILAEPETIHDPDALAELIARERVDVVFWLASFMVALDPARFEDIELIVTGGDQFSQQLVERWARPGRRIIYVYGPTEAVVFQSWVECEAAASVPPATIGLPMANMRYHLLDERDELVPIGVVGQLAIAGVAVGRGYLRGSELDVSKFGPLEHLKEGRAYRSGDLAVRREDGQLDFLGRADQQVKVRGHRIELVELEQALMRIPGVSAAAAVVALRSAVLHAIVVPAAGVELDAAELRARLSAEVPRYMLPAISVRDRLPQLPNGKVDRRALAELPIHRLDPARAPETEVERRLHALWVEILAREDIGIDDDFVALGGQSLDAMRLVVRIRAELAPELGVREFVDAGTIAALARRIEACLGLRLPQGDPHDEAMGARVDASDDRPQPHPGFEHPLAPGQQRLWLFDQLHPQRRHIYNVAVSWDIEGPLEPARLSAAFDQLVERHAILRTRFVERDGQTRQLVEPPRRGVLRVLDGSQDPDTLDATILARALEPFALERDDLVRAQLHRCGPNHHRLALIMHHMICDAWSLRVITNELAATYRGNDLASMPFQYGDYARWQLGRAHTTSLERWRSRHGSRIEPLDLPIDHPRSAEPSGRGAHHCFTLDGCAIAQLSSATHTSDYAVHSAALALVLGRICGSETVSFGSPVSGRERAEFDAQIGFYTDTAVFVHRLDPSARLHDLIVAVHDETLALVDHRAPPFDALVELVDAELDPSRHPLFDVWLTVQESGPARFELAPGLHATRRDVELPISLFDLSFQFERRDAETVAGRLQYDSALYEPETAALLTNYLVRLIADAPALLDHRLADIAIDEPPGDDPFAGLSFDF